MTNSSKSKSSIEINYNGMFVTSPFAYEGGDIKSLEIVNITNMEYSEFSDFLKKETDTDCSGIYYVTPGKELHNGLKHIKSDMDFKAFVNLGVNTKRKIALYLEHFDEDLTEYLEGVVKDKMVESENENETESDTMSSDDIEDDDDDDDDSDTASIDHLSADEVELSELRKTKMPFIKEWKLELGQGQNSLFDTDVDEELPKGDYMETEHENFLNDLSILLQKETQIVDMSKQGDKEKDKERDIKFPRHNPRTYWKKMKPILGERYETPKQLKECITNYAIANGYQIWFERNDHMRLLARCSKRSSNDNDAKCPWRLWATWMSNEKSFQVKSLVDEHKCSRNFKSASLVNYKWISKKFATKIRQEPRMKPAKLQTSVLNKYKCQVSLSLCIRAKAFALSEYEQGARKHYGKLWEYVEEVKRSNPGSSVKMNVEVNSDGLTFFKGFYVCFHGLKEGWKHGCRKVLGLGECFLKSVYKGVLLSAVGKDGNNQIFPIAWGVVNVENKENWSWFLELLKKDLNLDDGTGVTLISSQNTGVNEAVNNVVPQAEHRQCARHIYEDFTEKFTATHFKRLFWAASKASYPQEFDRVMEEIRVLNPDAYQYLMDKDPSTWSRVFFQTNVGCDAVENGISECFNSLISNLRRKPLVTLLESIRVIVMDRMSKIKEKAAKWDDDICPAIRKKLEHTKELERFWRVIPCGGSLFEVKHGVDVFMVDEIGKTCSCRMWQLSGLPCPHAVAAMFYINKLPEAYVPEWFRMHMFKETYNHELNQLNGIKTWPTTKGVVPLAPKVVVEGSRRKKLTRKREVMEGHNNGGPIVVSGGGTVNREGRRMTCKKCLQVGHNVRSCKNEKRDSPRKEARQPGRKKTVLPLGESSSGGGGRRGRKRKGLFGSEDNDNMLRGSESVPLAVCPPEEVQLLLEGRDEGERKEESEMELTLESQNGLEEGEKNDGLRDVDLNKGQEATRNEDEKAVTNEGQENILNEDQGPVPIEVEDTVPLENQEPVPHDDHEPVPHEDQGPVPIEVENPVPHEDKESVPHEDKEPVIIKVEDPVPHQDKEPVPHEDQESVPHEDQDPIQHEDEEPVPIEVEDPVPHKDQEPIVIEEQESIPNGDKEPIPNQGQGTVPNTDEDVIPNKDQECIPNEGQKSIAKQGQEAISPCESEEAIVPQQEMGEGKSEEIVMNEVRKVGVEKDDEGSSMEKVVVIDG